MWTNLRGLFGSTILLMGIGGLFPFCLSGQDAPSPPENTAAPSKTSDTTVALLTGDQERQALEFARNQHPELADLLQRLKESNASEYAKALQDLQRAQARLARFAERNPDRFSAELAIWKVNSRIRLLMARMMMDEDPALESQLKELVEERRSLRLAMLKADQAKAAERLARLNRQLEEMQRRPERATEKELTQLKREIAKQAKPAKGKGKSAKKPVRKDKAERPAKSEAKPGTAIPDPSDADAK